MLIRLLRYVCSGSYQRTSNWIWGHAIAYMVLFTASLIIALYALWHLLRHRSPSHRLCTVLICGYSALFIAFGIYVSVTDRNEYLLTFLTMQVSGYLIFLLPPAFSLALSAVSIAVYLPLLLRMQGTPYGVMINLFIMQVVVTIVCVLRYRQNMHLASEIEQTRKLNEQLRRLSMYDTLTGVKNRHALREEMIQFLDAPLYFAVLDVNDFKLINDQHGHLKGDEVLSALGTALGEVFPDSSYRYGGDEFLIIAPDQPNEEFVRKLDVLQETFRALLKDIHSSFSAGYVRGRANSTEQLSSMISEADRRMYQVKQDRDAS